MEKFVNSNGQVALLLSDTYGDGWWTDHLVDALLWSPKIITWILDGRPEERAEEIMDHIAGHLSNPRGQRDMGLAKFYFEIAERDLVVSWIPSGLKFVIDNYDGLESILTEEDFTWHAA